MKSCNNLLSVLIIAPLPPPVTGQSVAVQALFDQLNFDGHNVVLINMSKDTFRQGISSLSRVLEVLSLIWRTLRAGRNFDTVYLTNAESLAGNLKDMLLLAVLGRLRAKTWLHLHGGAGMRNLLADRTGWLGRLNAYFLRRVAGVIVLGERLAPIFDGYVKPDQVRVVKNFAADALFIDADRMAEKWADTKVLRVLFLSNLLPGKGHEELLNAIRSLSPVLQTRFRFDFAGGFESTTDKERFQATIIDLPGVHYHGVVHGEEKQALLAQAHVFCLPTFYPYEGQPISILEAYASGCMVLTTDHSGIFDIFTPGENGCEVEPRSPKSIMTALKKIAVDPSEAEKLARRNRTDADLHYKRQVHLSNLYTALAWNNPV
jgi:glycosyltransferase involved in cell wall biosynthesis